MSRNPTTARYSPENPFHPDYLKQAPPAIAAFVREINRHPRKWDLERPYTVELGWKAELEVAQIRRSMRRRRAEMNAVVRQTPCLQNAFKTEL